MPKPLAPDPLPVVGWTVWTASRVLRGKDLREWADAPDEIQLLRIEFDDGTRRVMYGADAYFAAQVDKGVVWGDHEGDDPELAIRDAFPSAVVKHGRWTSDENFDRIVSEALA